MKFLRWLLLALGVVLILDTLLIMQVSNLNLGVLLPAILGAPLLAAGLLWGRLQRGKAGRTLLRLLLAGYALFLLAFGATLGLLLAAPEEAPEPAADVVVVLGAGVRGKRVSLTLAMRLDTALAYARQSENTVILVTGGQGAGEDITEAQAMQGYLTARGFPQERILLEERASSTQENFRFAQEIIKERGPDAPRILFVTSDFHVFRARRVAQKEGVDARGLAAPTPWYMKPNNYLRETCVIWAYWLAGRL